jgi:hypothetical protein
LPEKKQQINVEVPEDEEGTYSNFSVINHSPAEFVIDFLRVLPGTRKSRVHARIIMAPQNVKAFLRALEENIKKYEERHGKIETTSKGQPDKQIGFQ